MFFDESSRLKIDNEKGLVRLSIKSSDYSVDEFIIPFSTFDAFYDKATSKENYESEFIKIKWMFREAIIQIRESKYKRRIFKFSEVRINKILSQFGSVKVVYLNWLSSKEIKAHEVTEDYLNDQEDLDFSSVQMDESTNEGDVLSKKLEEKIDKVIDICIQLGESVGALSSRVKELEHKIENVVITSSNASTQQTDDISFPFSDDEHFIPNDLNINFKGTMTSEATSSEDNASDAAAALKKLRGK